MDTDKIFLRERFSNHIKKAERAGYSLFFNKVEELIRLKSLEELREDFNYADETRDNYIDNTCESISANDLSEELSFNIPRNSKRRKVLRGYLLELQEIYIRDKKNEGSFFGDSNSIISILLKNTKVYFLKRKTKKELNL
jgi:hypothetical protein